MDGVETPARGRVVEEAGATNGFLPAEIPRGAAGNGVANDLSSRHLPQWREGLMRSLLAAIFLLFFQGFMVAPLIPHLAREFHVSRAAVGLVVPAYLLPYAFGTFTWGLLADRFGRRTVLFACLPLFAVCCALSASAPSVTGLVLWRIATGLGGGGIAVIALTLAADLFPVAERGRVLGWIYGAIAGGCAVGSTLGGVLTPLLGWRGLFLAVGVLSLLPLLTLAPYWRRLASPARAGRAATPAEVLRGYAALLGPARGRGTYLYVLLNGIFHSGVFTWLGAYLADRYRLGDAGIGLALLGYGVPGFFLGPLIGRWADRCGRGRLLPWGLGLAAATGALLIPHTGLPLAIAAITLLSLGFDMSHPLLAGIVTTLAPERRGQAMGLNGFAVFLGFALGSILFGWGMGRWGFAGVMSVFAAAQLLLAAGAVRLFRSEGPTHALTVHS